MPFASTPLYCRSSDAVLNSITIYIEWGSGVVPTSRKPQNHGRSAPREVVMEMETTFSNNASSWVNCFTWLGWEDGALLERKSRNH